MKHPLRKIVCKIIHIAPSHRFDKVCQRLQLLDAEFAKHVVPDDEAKVWPFCLDVLKKWYHVVAVKLLLAKVGCSASVAGP